MIALLLSFCLFLASPAPEPMVKAVPLDSITSIAVSPLGVVLLLSDTSAVICESYTLSASGASVVPGGAVTTISAPYAPTKFTTRYIDTGNRQQEIVTDCNGLDVRDCAARHRAAVAAMEAAFPPHG